MPFVRKTDSQGSQPPTDTRKLFIGRTGELLFFVQNILKPEEPTHNIISIWGQGGVGKSTLLARFIDEAHSPNFKDYCLTATVDELQTTPASMMEKFADQLYMKGEFGKALKHYKEALRKLQTEREKMQDAVLNRVPDFAGAAAEMVPVVGPLLREGAKATAGLYLDKRQKVQRYRDAEIIEDPLNELTRAFVNELNQLAESQVLVGSRRYKKRRVILFFDTFEQLATEAAPWLLDYFLSADISSNIVLVIAGRDPIERSFPDDTKRWLPYCDNETIYWIPLNSFTEDETRAYLIKRDITAPDRIATIWQLSQGLPLYLSLLTSNPRGKVDPAANVVANFLRWIPENEQVKRQLALDAALFSRPFTQDDLAAFTYLPVNELSSLYSWLIAQPFVRSQDGRYSYHDLARELFSRHLYQRSKKEYYATKRALSQHYQRLLGEIEMDEGKEASHSAEWLELELALAYQFLSLPDERSHIKAVEQILSVYKHAKTEQMGEVVRVLRELSQEQPGNQANSRSRQTTQYLLQYIGDKSKSQELVAAANYLLELLDREPAFSTGLLSRIYFRRGRGYMNLKEYQQAIADFDSALELNSNDPAIYNTRGHLYRELGEYKQAIADFDHALTLDLKDSAAYNGRGWTYYYHKEYKRAIKEFDCAIELNANNTAAIKGRGWAYASLKEYQQAFADLDHLIELASGSSWAYWSRGIIYTDLKEYHIAVTDYDRAIELDPSDTSAYRYRGYTQLLLKNIDQAKADFARSWELDQTSVYNAWLAEWTDMCQERPDPGKIKQLEIIAAIDPEKPVAFVCRGVAMWLLRNFEEALQELEQGIQIAPGMWYAYFWKGMTCVFLGREEDAKTAIEKALKLELPPILLTPLRWFEQDKPEFYEHYVVPLLARYHLG